MFDNFEIFNKILASWICFILAGSPLAFASAVFKDALISAGFAGFPVKGSVNDPPLSLIPMSGSSGCFIKKGNAAAERVFEIIDMQSEYQENDKDFDGRRGCSKKRLYHK